jgi:hypothetical protein
MNPLRALVAKTGLLGGVHPIDRTQERSYPEDFSGPIFIWDIDKTYLATEIHNWRGLLAVPFELAVDKRDIAGTAALLRALRRGNAPEGLTAQNPIYFVSASPPQLRGVIQKKMLIDGVEFDGISFKDQLALVLRGQFGKLREQIGYKLAALLMNRRELPEGADEYLFGDDSEADGTIYALYGDVCAGRIRGDALVAILLRLAVRREDAERIAALAEGLPVRDRVKAAFINLEVRKNPRRFQHHGRVHPCFDSIQTALVLHEKGLIPVRGVVEVAHQMATQFQRRATSLVRSVADGLERGLFSGATIEAVWPSLQHEGLAPGYFRVDHDRLPTPPSRERDDGFMTPAEIRGDAAAKEP